MYIAVQLLPTVSIHIRCFDAKARAPQSMGERAFWLVDRCSFVSSELVGNDEARAKNDTEH